jgi:hypothetical protein
MPAASLRVEFRDICIPFVFFLGALALPACAADSYAPDSATATFGYSSEVAVYGVGARWNLMQRIAFLEERRLDVRLDAQIAYWLGKGTPTPYRHVWDFGLTPVIRWTPKFDWVPEMFVEGGIGIHGLSATRINNDRQFAVAFQFGEIVGVGTTFGARNQFEIEAFFQHVSNGRIKAPNWGLSYPGILLRVALP